MPRNTRISFSGRAQTGGQRDHVRFPPKSHRAARGKKTMFVAGSDMGMTKAKRSKPMEKILFSMSQPFNQGDKLPPMLFPIAENEIHTKSISRESQASACSPPH